MNMEHNPNGCSMGVHESARGPNLIQQHFSILAYDYKISN